MKAIDFIDIHYHANPDLYLRRESALSAGRQYQVLGGAVILKSHLGSTVQAAETARAEGLPVFPSLVLNDIAGGLGKRAIFQALSEYTGDDQLKLLVHLPTIRQTGHKSTLKRVYRTQWAKEYAIQASSLISDGALKPDVLDILKMSKDHPIIISSGHASKEEVLLLIAACQHLKVKAFMLNQPANPMTGLCAAELEALVNENKFLWVEQCALTYYLGYQSWEDMMKVLRDIPRVVYSSDLGQTTQADISAWWKESCQWFKKMRLGRDRIADITKLNQMNMLKVGDA